MDAEAVRAFVNRDWGSVESSKMDYWAERYRQDPLSTWKASQILLAHVRQVRMRFPTAEDRALDLRTHMRLRSQLERAAHAFADR